MLVNVPSEEGFGSIPRTKNGPGLDQLQGVGGAAIGRGLGAAGVTSAPFTLGRMAGLLDLHAVSETRGNVNPIWPHCDGLKWPHLLARSCSSCHR